VFFSWAGLLWVYVANWCSFPWAGLLWVYVAVNWCSFPWAGLLWVYVTVFWSKRVEFTAKIGYHSLGSEVAFCGPLNDTVSISGYKASNVRVMNEK
jgi:hypothetical protein